jgi:hypothetical protein
MLFLCSFSIIKICKSFEKYQLMKTPDINTHLKKLAQTETFGPKKRTCPGQRKYSSPSAKINKEAMKEVMGQRLNNLVVGHTMSRG